MSKSIQHIVCPYKYGRPRQITAGSGHREDVFTVFLAGGITNCRDWQSEIANLFDQAVRQTFGPVTDGEQPIVLFNPRRPYFVITDTAASCMQIEWEHHHLNLADITLFWFPHETLCPITLYELGVAAAAGRRIFVGCDPDYQRKYDVSKQLSLIRPEVTVVDNLQQLVDQVVTTVHKCYNF